MSDEAHHPSWVRSAQGLASALPGLVTDRLELLALELHRAGRDIVRIVTLLLLAAILGVTAWLALCAGVALALVALGMPWPQAVLVVLLINAALAWATLVRIQRLVAGLGLPATRRHLAFGIGAEPFGTPTEGRP